MAALPAAQLPDGPEWLYEVKWDGYRALGLKHGDSVRLLSRNNKSLAADFSTIVNALRTISADTALVDGEIVALAPDGTPSFQALQNRASNGAEFRFYAFDLLQVDGEDLRARALTERRERLEAILRGSAVPLSIALEGSAAEVIAAVSKLGLEGVIAKRRTSAYSPGDRNSDWQKLRLNSEQEFVIGGYRPGLKNFESILVGYYEKKKLVFASKVRAGFNPHTRQAVWEKFKGLAIDECPFTNLPDADKKGRWGEGITAEDMKELRWVKPQVVVQVSFVEWTSRGHLRHANYKGLRADKKPTAVVREHS
jgi:bifunctional non-homologous end joining protein LigD